MFVFKRSALCLTILLCLLALAPVIFSQVPTTIYYQGRLTDAVGDPLPNASYDIAFKIYNLDAGGTELWSEQRSVDLIDSFFDVMLGEIVPLDNTVFNGNDLWLEITMRGDSPMSPRIPIVSVPYAFYSAQAAIALSVPNGSITGDKIADGGAKPGQILKYDGSTWVAADDEIGASGSGDITSVIAGDALEGGGTSGDVTLGVADNSILSVHIGDSQVKAVDIGPGVVNNSHIVDGAITSSKIATGAVNASAIASGQVNSDHILNSSITGADIATGTITTSDIAVGTITTADIADGTILTEDIDYLWRDVIVDTAAVLDDHNTFRRNNTFTDVVMWGSPIAVWYDPYDEDFKFQRSSSDISMLLDPKADKNINSEDIYAHLYIDGQYNDPVSTSIPTAAYLRSNNTGPSFGLLVSATSSANSATGIYAHGSGTTGSFAGWFAGNCTVTQNLSVLGTLSKSAGSFRIDHPLDPENKYLQHSFVESPDMMNIYNGNIVTDANGYATVTMPDYFEALNRDFRYQLTVIGEFAQAIIAEEISNREFKIRTDKPNIKVSWQVTGIRHDPYATEHPIEVVVEKENDKKGTYLNPALYNMPEDRSENYKIEQVVK